MELRQSPEQGMGYMETGTLLQCEAGPKIYSSLYPCIHELNLGISLLQQQLS